VFYADFFPRAGKRQGAWMTSFVNQKMENGVNVRPHVSIVCNFTKPTESKPSLLSFDEVTTLFHEFGHALHGMCANGQYGSISGTSVYWDFVELPSQILENWCYEKECLDLFAKHYETGEAIPADYIQKIVDSSNFQSGLATIRQIGLATLDMAWHSQNPKDITNVKDFEMSVTSKTDLMPSVPETCTSCSFSHIFPGGYSSGYYSYKWAEVIDADAFEAFKEKGIFNQEVATAFYKNILSAGGSEHPSILYKRFRGREADPKALLRRSGLIKERV
jgi:peptidyl-dipeptidase Dcp